MSLTVSQGKLPDCHATVIVPVANEESYLQACLNALYHQTVSLRIFEVIVLINNCTDASASLAKEFQHTHPHFALHVLEHHFPKPQANIGTVRRLLMDEASRRLGPAGAILSTDGDSAVAADWVEANLRALCAGSDAVGGDITLLREDYARLSARARFRHEADDAYQRAVTRLESLIDPDPHDPWPRHHHHFGASLSCRNSLYRSLGGLPVVDCLEDVAFVKAMAQADAKLRHSPAVQVVTAARTQGRARIGLASQLREWKGAQQEPLVDTAAFLEEYFDCRRRVRQLWREGGCTGVKAIARRLQISEPELGEMATAASTFGALHDALDLRGNLWRSMQPTRRVAKQSTATEQILRLCQLRNAEEHPADTFPRAHLPTESIPGGAENNRVPGHPWKDSPRQTA